MFDGSDSSLVLSHLRTGGMVELTNLFESQRSHLRSMIKRSLSSQFASRFDPSDIIQEAYIRAGSQLEKYLSAPNVHPNAWIRILCRQLLCEQTRNHLRKCRNPVKEVAPVDGEPVVELLADSTESVGTKLCNQESERQLWDDLANLPPLDREIIDMRHADCMTFREIGTLLEMHGDTVKKRYYRALESLRKNVSPDEVSARHGAE